MVRLIQLDEIEEFEQTKRVPRAAISDSILAGIRTLDERRTIEPFLREILADKNETPHTSTEKADILTHVTVAGQSCFAAFVNKGKATKQVRSEKVSHQLVRAGEIPGVRLLVLLAVGHIQDDIYNAIDTTARGMGADYLIVDATDVARLFIAYQKVCPRDGSPYSDGDCSRCGASASEPPEVTLRVYDRPHYDVLHLHDDSTGLAKQYSADIVTAAHYSKTSLREVVRAATWELRHSTYRRDETSRAAHGDRSADCVMLFVYPTMRDKQHTNWRCRTLWIRLGLPAGAHPLPFQEGEWLGDIQIDWNAFYLPRRDFFAEQGSTKNDWVRKIEAQVLGVGRLVREADMLVAAFRDDRLPRQDFEAGLRASRRNRYPNLGTLASPGARVGGRRSGRWS